MHHRQNFLIPPHDGIIVFSLVRVETAATVFITVRQKIKCAAAVLAERNQRAIAEKTDEIIGICTWMAGEVFTFFVCKIRIVMGHKDNLLKENAHPDQNRVRKIAGDQQSCLPFLSVHHGFGRRTVCTPRI